MKDCDGGEEGGPFFIIYFRSHFLAVLLLLHLREGEHWEGEGLGG